MKTDFYAYCCSMFMCLGRGILSRPLPILAPLLEAWLTSILWEWAPSPGTRCRWCRRICRSSSGSRPRSSGSSPWGPWRRSAYPYRASSPRRYPTRKCNTKMLTLIALTRERWIAIYLSMPLTLLPHVFSSISYVCFIQQDCNGVGGLSSATQKFVKSACALTKIILHW